MLGKVSGQGNFVFIGEVYGRTLDGLANFQIQNFSGQAHQGKVYLTVKENISKNVVVNMVSPLITLSQGNNQFPVSAYTGSSFSFPNNAMAAIVSQTRNFPPGEYTYTFRFQPNDKSDDFESVVDANIQPLVPINLISPADQDKICEKRPPLSWQPPVPYPPSMRFRLQLTEKKRGSDIENLLMSAPLVLLDNIPSTTVSYPSYAPDLQEGHTYVWQVIAYQNGIILSKSDIWEFTVQCSDSAKANPNDSYRELRELVNGNYYYATTYLKFSYQNHYNIRKLDYEIYETEGGSKKIKNLPDIPLNPGHNKIDIDLSQLDLEEGKHYIIKVYPFNEPAVIVRFVYQENSNQ